MTALRLGFSSGSCQKGWLKMKGRPSALRYAVSSDDVAGPSGDLLDLAELPAVEHVDVDVDRMADVPGIEDLDLDGRHESFARPADLVVGGHRVVVREGDVGHAEPAGLRDRERGDRLAGSG